MNFVALTKRKIQKKDKDQMHPVQLCTLLYRIFQMVLKRIFYKKNDICHNMSIFKIAPRFK